MKMLRLATLAFAAGSVIFAAPQSTNTKKAPEKNATVASDATSTSKGGTGKTKKPKNKNKSNKSTTDTKTKETHDSTHK
jgi:hypothetical protein